MNPFQPVYTEKAHCQDCYRCVRNCPVKAIRIENGVASVVEELCIHCGRCVNSCPSGAKRIRNDRAFVRMLLGSGDRVITSLAPSYAAEFEGVEPRALIHALKQLGFHAVSETALGAEEVAAHAARLLDSPEPRVWISSACPTVVEYVRKYRPELVPSLTPFASPLIAHCRLLKRGYGADTHVVFFGPCIAKKKEAHDHAELLDAALTFEDLRTMLTETGIELMTTQCDENDDFVPHRAREGALYPVDGGMVACIKDGCTVHDGSAMHFSGMDEVCSVLESVGRTRPTHTLFLELLACAGGCINGPRAASGSGTLAKRMAVLNHAQSERGFSREVSIDIEERFTASDARAGVFDEEAIVDVLRSTGKHTTRDELNCGGCGYANCRELAIAVLAGKAETAMCVTYLRQLAHKKANKLIMAMPAGVVIVDKQERIIECNHRFAALADNETEDLYCNHGGLQHAILEKVLPVSQLFRHVLRTGEEILDKDLRINGRIVRCSVFVIEPEAIAGGVFSDVTAPELEKDEIIARARDVIGKNLTTVQQIAYLLGENASETEMVLSGIIESFTHRRSEGQTNGRE